MIRFIFLEADDTKDYDDFDSYARDNLDDFNLPSDLVGAIENVDGDMKLISLSKLEEYAISWHNEREAEYRETIGL